MKTYFVPYTGKVPAAVNVNGHKMVILSRDRECLQEDLNLIGADNLRQIRRGESEAEERVILHRLASKAGAGVVIAPGALGLREIIRNLEAELPWLQ